ncbi:MAG: tetratricopeptide repeat protein [Chlorobi bacterium]|nr:tetratricopeptide repeat protein [Chlorobiota bacterium]
MIGLSEKYKALIYLFLLILFTVFIYSFSLNNKFLPYLDDGKLIINNLLVKNFSFQGILNIFKQRVYGLYHPITTLIWFFEFHYFKLNPLGYHIINTLFHLLNTLLVYYLISLITTKKGAAIIIATLFAIHPMHVESVVWLSELKDVLYSFFYLTALICYQLYLQKNEKLKFLIASFLLFIFSLLSKSAAVTLPVIFILFDYYSQRKFNLKSIYEKIPFFILSIVIGLINIKTQQSDQFITDLSSVYTLSDRFFLLTYSISYYFIKIFVPSNLSAKNFYPEKVNGLLPSEYYYSVLIVLLLLLLFFTDKKHRKQFIFGIGFFFITISLVLKIIPTGNDLVSNRYTYIPYIGVFYYLFVIINDIRNNYLAKNKYFKSVPLLTFLIYSIIFLTLSIKHVKTWHGPISLWNNVLNKYPESAIAYNERGQAYMVNNNFQEAINDLNKSIELNPDFALAYINRGIVESKNRNYQTAINDFNKSIVIDGKNPEAFVNRGKCYVKLGQNKKALNDFDSAIKLDNEQTAAYNNKGILLAQQNDYDKAVRNFTKAISLNSYQTDSYINRGLAYFKLKNYEKAKADIYTVINKKSKSKKLRYVLAQCELTTNNIDKAIYNLNELLKNYPNDLKSIYFRANIFVLKKDYKSAVNDFSVIIKAQPDNTNALLNRGNSYFYLNDLDKACNDWEKAKQSGNENAKKMVLKYCK